MKTLLTSLVILWMLTGGLAAFQRGDFADGNCSTATDTVLLFVLGPFTYAAPETLERTCSQPA